MENLTQQLDKIKKFIKNHKASQPYNWETEIYYDYNDSLDISFFTDCGTLADAHDKLFDLNWDYYNDLHYDLLIDRFRFVLESLNLMNEAFIEEYEPYGSHHGSLYDFTQEINLDEFNNFHETNLTEEDLYLYEKLWDIINDEISVDYGVDWLNNEEIPVRIFLSNTNTVEDTIGDNSKLMAKLIETLRRPEGFSKPLEFQDLELTLSDSQLASFFRNQEYSLADLTNPYLVRRSAFLNSFYKDIDYLTTSDYYLENDFEHEVILVLPTLMTIKDYYDLKEQGGELVYKKEGTLYVVNTYHEEVVCDSIKLEKDIPLSFTKEQASKLIMNYDLDPEGNSLEFYSDYLLKDYADERSCYEKV